MWYCVWAVKMSEEVWLTCLTHALSKETEEIMGLLLGDVEVTLLFQEPLLVFVLPHSLLVPLSFSPQPIRV